MHYATRVHIQRIATRADTAFKPHQRSVINHAGGIDTAARPRPLVAGSTAASAHLGIGHGWRNAPSQVMMVIWIGRLHHARGHQFAGHAPASSLMVRMPPPPRPLTLYSSSVVHLP